MRSLNLEQLRTFVEVVAQDNYSAAGRQLNLTQPAVSLHVRELEYRFGVRVVERVGRRAYPTAPGRDLAVQAQRIFNDCEIVESMMRRFREGLLGRVRIAGV
jgi:DNA-binding transcriptional LysR family regulator